MWMKWMNSLFFIFIHLFFPTMDWLSFYTILKQIYTFFCFSACYNWGVRLHKDHTLESRRWRRWLESGVNVRTTRITHIPNNKRLSKFWSFEKKPNEHYINSQKYDKNYLWSLVFLNYQSVLSFLISPSKFLIINVFFNVVVKSSLSRYFPRFGCLCLRVPNSKRFHV